MAALLPMMKKSEPQLRQGLWLNLMMSPTTPVLAIVADDAKRSRWQKLPRGGNITTLVPVDVLVMASTVDLRSVLSRYKTNAASYDL